MSPDLVGPVRDAELERPRPTDQGRPADLPWLPLMDLELPPDEGPFPPPDRGQPPDTRPLDACGIPCGGGCCTSNQLCVMSTCVLPVGPCTSDADCYNDSYCWNGKCIPFGAGPTGTYNDNCMTIIPLGRFASSLQCAWDSPPTSDKYPRHNNVLGTPTVAHFRIPGKGSSPFIVFVSYDRTDGGGQAARCDSGAFGVIRLIRGSDCKQMYTVEGVKVRASSPLAIGDITTDKMPDIVAYRCGGGLVAITYDKVRDAFVQLWQTSSTFASSSYLWSGPSIHDLDGDGKPEILMEGAVFDHTGKLLDGSLGGLSRSPHPGGFSVVADVDRDGRVELVTGRTIHEWNPGLKRWTTQLSTGNPRGLMAVADFGTFGADPAKDDRGKIDGVAEVAMVYNGTVRVMNILGRTVFGPLNLPQGGRGGPPTVGDFDNDGPAELACAGYGSYTVFDPDCWPGASKTTCYTQTKNGVLWTRPSQDHSSSSTGSSIFDFEGDGKAEAIYADECFARVYEGTTGEVVFSQYHSSCTWYENPIVADVDGDDRSELVVPSNTNCSKAADCARKNPKLPGTSIAMDPLYRSHRCQDNSNCPGGACVSGFCRCATDKDCGGGSYRCGPPVSGTPGSGKVCRSVLLGPVAGIQVYRDIQDRWVPSRPIWNQHPYAVSHVNDDGTIPRTGDWKPHWTLKGLNNFRQNHQGAQSPSKVPDVTSNLSLGVVCHGKLAMDVNSQICNRGSKIVGQSVSVAFYLGDPSKGGTLACVEKTKTALGPGACEKLTCTVKPAPTTSTDIYVVADDDGKGKAVLKECQSKNNWSVIKGVICK